MTTRKQTKYVHEGRYLAEVDVDLLDTGDGWSPYLSLKMPTSLMMYGPHFGEET